MPKLKGRVTPQVRRRGEDLSGVAPSAGWSVICCPNGSSVLSAPPAGESIQIFAEIENCSSRMVVPKAAIYQTQTFYAKGKMKEVKQLVANLRGESLSSGKTETWSGKMLKIPPVSPSILDCTIIRVEYSLMVSTLLAAQHPLANVFITCLGCNQHRWER